MSFCKNCGTNMGDANFCPNCGKPNFAEQPKVDVQQTAADTAFQAQAQSYTLQQEQLRIQQEQLKLQQQQRQTQMYKESQKMVCPRCKNNNVMVQAVAEQKKRGCLMSCVWILLAIFTIGMIIWIPLLTKKGSKTRTYAVCQSCGFRWKVS